MPAPIVVSLLLKSTCANAPERDNLREALSALGLAVTTEGSVSWTIRVQSDLFEELFGMRPVPLPGKPPGPHDKGTPPGYVCEQEPCIPDPLRPYVERVGVEPPLTRFQ